MRRLGSWAVAVCCALTSSAVLAQSNDAETLILSDTSTKSAETGGDQRTLAQLVEEALVRNRQIKIDEARIAEAKALYELAASQAYPRISGQALFGGPTPERKLSNPDDVGSLTPSSREGDFDFGSFGITFRAQAEGVLPLYTFGKISAAKDAARAVERAAEHKVTITEAEVVMNIHRAFWAYQLTRSFVDSLKDGEKTLEKVLGKIEELLDADSGQVTENDRLRMLHALATVRVKKNEAQYANDLSHAALKLLSGREQSDRLSVAFADLDELPPEIPNVSEYASAAQEQRPELRALRALVDAHQRFEDYRRNNFWPDFFLGGIFRYAYTSNSTDVTNPFIYDDANFVDVGAGLGLRVQLDVFTKLAELEQAQAAKMTRTREVEAVAQAIDLEVRKIHHDLENGYQRISLLERANRAARGWLTASTLAYDVGTGDAAELIDSFLAWAASEGELQKTRYDMQLAHADLARSAGKLVGYRGGSERRNP
jgi:outer membrane protein, multidrug efflux system